MKKICTKCQAEYESQDYSQEYCPDCMQNMMAATEPDSSEPPRQTLRATLDLDEVKKVFPQFEIIQQIGHGGMGSVFKARQRHLDRFVALKILSTDLAEKQAFAERFAREGKLLARLDHPNIVTVYDFGQTETVDENGGKTMFFYLVLEYVDGSNLRQVISDRKFSPEQMLMIVPKICQAVQYAHGEGVLHRDIKPENILIDGKGRVKIADFGIGKLMQTQTDTYMTTVVDEEESPEQALTQMGSVLGTPRYMAPEQLETPNMVDQRADIYSLGMVFYEMLTGKLPYGNISASEQILSLGSEINKIMQKAIDHDLQKRFQSVQEFQTEIETVIKSQHKNSKPESDTVVYQPEKKPARGEKEGNAAIAFFLVGGFILMFAVVLGIAFSGILDLSGKTEPPAPFVPAPLVEETALVPVTVNGVMPFPAEKSVDTFGEGRAWRLQGELEGMDSKPRFHQLSACKDWSQSYSMNEAGTQILIGSNKNDSKARVFDLESFRVLGEMPNNGEISCVAFHPTIALLISVDQTPTLHVWDASSHEKISDFTPFPESDLMQIGISQNGRHMILGTEDGRVFDLDCESGEVVREYAHIHEGCIQSIAFHKDNKRFATAGNDRKVHIWNVDQEEPILSIVSDVDDDLHLVRFTPDGTKVAYSTKWKNKFVNVHDIETGELWATYGGYDKGIRSFAFSPDGRWLATGDVDYRAVIWDVQTKKPVWTATSQTGNHVYGLMFAPDQRLIVVVAGFNPTVYQLPSSFGVSSQ